MPSFKSKNGRWTLISGGAQGIRETYSRGAAPLEVGAVVNDIDPFALDDVGFGLPRSTESSTCR
ncbi:hypothetical protein RUE5091_00088 [Ruegeria denitrificans]|uniref:Uncharacterized protein n=1 Tax=Ruegeria denitrificans TaxID=1715692 RepID=A0A0P1I0L3_9RHOB|nr:hypothetical protein RUE5091_00088 [Ruegeria denitrificans]